MEAVECLVSAGASKDIVDQTETSARDMAVQRGHKAIAQFLEKQAPQANVALLQGSRQLHRGYGSPPTYGRPKKEVTICRVSSPFVD